MLPSLSGDYPNGSAEVDQLSNNVIRDLLFLTVLTGIRKATVCAIRREDVSLQKATLTHPETQGWG